MSPINYSIYEDYDAEFNRSDRKNRRKRKQKAVHVPKRDESDVIESLTETLEGLEGGFKTTYTPSRFEATWLLSSLQTFYERQYINDVLALVRGGKEATVYRCEAHSQTGESFVAAKVYRPKMFRNIRNDAQYREGRAILLESGREAKANDKRMIKALGKRTDFGDLLIQSSWLMYEYTSLQRLHEAGADVPKPFAQSSNAIIMGYVGDASQAAPTLSDTRLTQNEAKTLYQKVMMNIEIMLKNGIIHGDLSAYNILYWEGEMTIIDFPQYVSPESNRAAKSIFMRDIERICMYFNGYGMHLDAEKIGSNLWTSFFSHRHFDELADASRFEITEEY